ncbi:peptidoglycan-binding domain-containing protein [Streptomyces cinerochromogenes]|uniref:peptidoglycan-binding domain-containing protein n=1 Tax=Streptomyces cinerochromogenes TaxID=66422 RepID=UPI0033A16BAC
MRKKIASLAVVAVMAGSLGLAAAGTGQAAVPAPTSVTSATSAYYNLGLTTSQAAGIQCWLNVYDWGPLVVDGRLGTASWKSFQRFLAANYGYAGAIDGVPGTNTIMALQRLLARFWDYTGPIDGIAGSGTQAAFARMAANRESLC